MFYHNCCYLQQPNLRPIYLYIEINFTHGNVLLLQLFSQRFEAQGYAKENSVPGDGVKEMNSVKISNE